MEPERYLQLIEADAAALLRSAERDLDAVVPCCAGWSARDVLLHTAEVYQHKLASMRLQRDPDPWPPAWTIDDPVAWFAASADELVTELRQRGPAAASFTWHEPDQTTGFWFRRMAQETAVHRVDAELAVGEATPVDGELAVDGIDEVLDLFLSGDWSDLPQPGPDSAVLLRAGDREWLVLMRPDSVRTIRNPPPVEPADAVLTADPSAVLLWLWGRAPVDVVTVTGDDGAVAALRQRLVLATQ